MVLSKIRFVVYKLNRGIKINKKNNLLIFVVLAIFLLISSVSAESDIQTNSTDLLANTDNGLNLNNSLNVINDKTFETNSADDVLNLNNSLNVINDKTFEINSDDDWHDAWLNMKFYAGTVTLNINTNLDISGVLDASYYDYSSQYPSTTLIINGNGNTIHCDNRFRFLTEVFLEKYNQKFLQIYDGKHVFLNDLTLHGFGLTSDRWWGGLIWMTGNSYLDINNCRILDNDVGPNGKGVITLEGTSHLKMTNSTIQNTFIYGLHSKSGGVYVLKPEAEAILYNCTFKDIGTDDDKARWGGAIFTYGKLYCDGCTFENVKARYGAAVYIQDAKSNVKLQNCNFIKCKASENGIIYVDGKKTKNIDLTKCTFIDNIVLEKNPALIYLNSRYQEISLRKCIFYNSHVDYTNIAYLAATFSNQKILFDQCFRFNYVNIGNTGHGNWSQNWLSQYFEGAEYANLYDIKTYRLVFKDSNNRTIDDMPNCPALPVKVKANVDVLSKDIVPMNKKNKGTFEVKFDYLTDHHFYCYEPSSINPQLRKTVKLGNAYISLETNLKKDVVNVFPGTVDISLNLYYNNNKNVPVKNELVFYSLDGGDNKQVGYTDEKGHVDLHLNGLQGMHNITFFTAAKQGITPLNAKYTIFVKMGTKFVDVTITGTDDNFIIKGKLLDSAGNVLPSDLIFIEIKQINGDKLILTNTTYDDAGSFTYEYGSKLPKGTYLVSLTYKENEFYAGTNYRSQIVIDGKSTVLNVPSEINGALDSQVLIHAYLTVAGENYNLPKGVWFYTTQDWYDKFVSGRCTFEEIEWYNNNQLTPVKLDYANGIALGVYGSNVMMDFSVFPSFGTYYAFFIVPAEKSIDSSDAFNISCLNVKIDSDMQVIPNATSIYYGESINLDITVKDKLDKSATGQAEIYINDKFVQSVYLDNGYANAVLKDFKIGDNKIEVKYLGDNYFAPANKSVNINVKKKDLNFDVFIDDVTYGFMVVAYIDGLPVDFNGNIQFVISKGGVIVSTLNFTPKDKYYLGNNYEIGSYDVFVKASNDERYNDKSVTTSFNVDKRNTVVEIDAPDYIKIGNDITVKFNVLPSSATGDVTISLTDKAHNVVYQKTVNVKDKSIKIDKSCVVADESYKIIVQYNGDNHHNSSVAESNLTVVAKDITQISAIVEDIYYMNEHVVIEFSVNVVDYLYSVNEGTVTARLYYQNGTMVLDKTVDVIDHKVDLGFLNEEDTYKIYLTYNGNENYLNSSNFYYFDVVKSDSEIDVSVRYDSNKIPILSIYVTPIDATGSYCLIINNNVYGYYNVSTNEIVLDNLSGGFYDVIVYYEGDSKYNPSSALTNFTVRYDPIIIIEVSYDYDKDIFNVVTILPNDATGEYILFADEKIVGSYPVSQKNIPIPNLGEGNHSFTVYYKGDSKYKPGTNTTVFTTENTSFVDLDINYDDKTKIATLNIQVLPFIATGQYTVFINKEEYGTFDVSVNKITLNDLKVGEYMIEVIYWGDNVYNPSYNYDILTVNIGLEITPMETPFITFTDDLKQYGVIVTYNKELLSDAVVKFTVDGITYSKITDEKGIAELPIDLAPGDYDIVVSSGGLVINDTIRVIYRGVEITPIETPFIIFIGDLKQYGVIVTYNKELLSDAVVKFTVDGITYSKITDEKGIAELPIDLAPGDYDIVVSSDGVVINDTIHVKSTIYSQDLVKYYLNGTQFSATFLDADGKHLVNSEVMFNINGKTYYKYTDVRGVATLNINLLPGKYVITTVNRVTGEDVSNKVTVLNSLFAQDVVKYYKNGTQYKVRLLESDDKGMVNETVAITVCGKTYYRVTDADGFATLNINLLPGEYDIVASYEGESVFNKVTVLNSLFAQDVVKYYKNGTQYKVRLLESDDKGMVNETVAITVCGKTYYKVTDADGFATLNINLLPGEYDIVASYEGESVFNKVTVLNSLFAQDVFKYYKNGTQYKVRLLESDDKGMVNETVLITVCGKTYYKVTDADGFATLNINLDPGEYDIVASYEGESVFNKVTVLNSLFAQDVFKYYKNGTQYKVRLLESDDKGMVNKTVLITVCGKYYLKVTDADGFATLNINLLPGEYDIVASYNGEEDIASAFGCESVYNKVTVLSNLQADDLVKTYGTPDQFTCKLIDGTGVPIANETVAILICGKIYNKVTDAEGIARLNINLLPGVYSAVSSYGDLSITNTVTVK